MGFKFKLILRKEFEIDTKRDWGDDHETLIEYLKNIGVEAGNQAGADEIHDAIREMLSDDIEHVVDIDLNGNDFEIDISPGTTVEVPADDEGDE